LRRRRVKLRAVAAQRWSTVRINWRRGLVFAGIHLAIAGTLGCWELAVRESTQKAWSPAAEISGIVLAAQEEQTVNFNPCEMWVHYSPEDHLIIGLDLPAVLVTGNMDPCPPRWSLGSMLQPSGKPYTGQTYKTLAIAFAVLVAVQWFFMGSFPLRRARRWWAEPGAFITACGCIGGGPLVLFILVSLVELKARGVLWHTPDVLRIVADLAGVIATFAWFWWFGLLVWRLARGGWRLVRMRMKAA
jgi:hypothetical protein